jgi:hypothetical protein
MEWLYFNIFSLCHSRNGICLLFIHWILLLGDNPKISSWLLGSSFEKMMRPSLSKLIRPESKRESMFALRKKPLKSF